jgi:hypothetical protein
MALSRRRPSVTTFSAGSFIVLPASKQILVRAVGMYACMYVCMYVCMYRLRYHEWTNYCFTNIRNFHHLLSATEVSVLGITTYKRPNNLVEHIFLSVTKRPDRVALFLQL